MRRQERQLVSPFPHGLLPPFTRPRHEFDCQSAPGRMCVAPSAPPLLSARLDACSCGESMTNSSRTTLETTSSDLTLSGCSSSATNERTRSAGRKHRLGGGCISLRIAFQLSCVASCPFRCLPLKWTRPKNQAILPAFPPPLTDADAGQHVGVALADDKREPVAEVADDVLGDEPFVLLVL